MTSPLPSPTSSSVYSPASLTHESPVNFSVGDLLGKTVTVQEGAACQAAEELLQAPALPEPKKVDVRVMLLEFLTNHLQELEGLLQSFREAGNKPFIEIVEQRIVLWKGHLDKSLEVFSEQGNSGTYDVTFLKKDLELDALLPRSPDASLPHFMVSTLSSFYVGEVVARAAFVQVLVKGNEKISALCEPHFKQITEKMEAGELVGTVRCWKELLEELLPQVDALESEQAKTELKLLAPSLGQLQRLFELESFDADIFALIYASNFIRDAQILASVFKEGSDEYKGIGMFFGQMQMHLAEGNPLAISMLWNGFLFGQIEFFLGKSYEQDEQRKIAFVYQSATKFQELMTLVGPGVHEQGPSEEEISTLIAEVSKNLLALTDQIAAEHPEFSKRLGQWLGDFSTDNRRYRELIDQGKKGMIQHPEKIAVWVEELTAIINKGFKTVPEAYNQTLETAKSVAQFVAGK